MLNEQRIEHLRLAIQSSSLLEDHEKGDWLNLLELMNDKQLGELEEILAGPAPAKTSTPTAPVTPSIPSAPQTMATPLSHISNLPSGIRPPSPQPQEPVIKDSPSLIKAKKEPAVQSKPQTATQKFDIPKPQPRPTTPPPSRPSNLPPMNPLVIKDMAGVQTLTVNTLRQHEHRSVINAMQMIAQSYGYFATLQNLEASALYKSYLMAGKNRLAGKPDSTLSQAEFELVADILQAMRLNRS